MEHATLHKLVRGSVALTLAGALAVPAGALADTAEDEAAEPQIEQVQGAQSVDQESAAQAQKDAASQTQGESQGQDNAKAGEESAAAANDQKASASDNAGASSQVAPQSQVKAEEPSASAQVQEAAANAAEPAASNAQENATNDAALDSTNLSDDIYTASFTVQRADRAGTSMANRAFDGKAQITVKNGVYSVQLTLQPITVGALTGYVDELAGYNLTELSSDQTVNNAALYGSTVTSTMTGNDDKTYPKTIVYRLQDAAKSNGISPVRLHIPLMGQIGSDSDAYQNVYIEYDWSTLAKTSSTDPATPTDPSNPSSPSDPATPADPATPTDPVPAPTPTPTPSSSTDNASSNAAAAAAAQSGTATKQSYQVGHVYSVPMWITKHGSGETSMANQYFGSTAYVRPQSNGKYYVDITTSRADWITSVSYNGQSCQVVSQNGNTATYRIVMDAATTTTTIPIAFTVKPMGNATQTADLHLGFGNPKEISGSDSGQEPSSTNDPNVAATKGASAGVVPQTSDSEPEGVLASLAGAAALGAAGMITALKRMRKQKER